MNFAQGKRSHLIQDVAIAQYTALEKLPSSLMAVILNRGHEVRMILRVERKVVDAWLELQTFVEEQVVYVIELLLRWHGLQ